MICQTCKIEKNVWEYYKSPRLRRGHESECKGCRKIRNRRNRAKNIEKYRKHERGYNKKYYQRNREKILHYCSKRPPRPLHKIKLSRLKQKYKKRQKNLARKKLIGSFGYKISKKFMNNLYNSIFCFYCGKTIKERHIDHVIPI